MVVVACCVGTWSSNNKPLHYVQTLNPQEGRCKKDLMSHHDFIKQIALCWINPQE